MRGALVALVGEAEVVRLVRSLRRDQGATCGELLPLRLRVNQIAANRQFVYHCTSRRVNCAERTNRPSIGGAVVSYIADAKIPDARLDADRRIYALYYVGACSEAPQEVVGSDGSDRARVRGESESIEA